ncbi:MAG TPA: LysM peptidoglycan-binding domain-containing protein [Desulfuromonadales bacterium]|nr:LysM peptidoglycan-binding domain-containing protein [Desulfuromonadales bacterium]
MILRWAFLIFILLALIACAKPPLFEKKTAEHVIAQAKALDAQQYAPTEYQAALEAFRDGQALMDQGNYRAAGDALEFALEHARRAVSVTNETRAREVAEAAERARRRAAEEARARQAAEEARQRAAEEARIKAAAAAEEKSREVKPEPQQPSPEPVEIQPVATYLVGEGETLWTIAAQPSVYGDGHLWPLLYQANRDQIKNPREIFPGQTLSIRRDLSPEEIEEAREKAKASDIFPIPE